MSAKVALLLVFVCACSGGAEPSTTVTFQAPQSPEEVVERLIDDLRQRDNAGAAELVVSGQLRLVALAEGKSVAEAAGADEQVVGSNFWAAFTEAVGPDALSGLELSGEEPTLLRAEAVDFAFVTVSLGGERRLFVTRHRQDGWYIDVIATFAEVLGSRYEDAITRVAESADAVTLGPIMVDQVPSMMVVIELPGADAVLQQAMLRAVASVGR